MTHVEADNVRLLTRHANILKRTRSDSIEDGEDTIPGNHASCAGMLPSTCIFPSQEHLSSASFSAMPHSLDRSVSMGGESLPTFHANLDIKKQSSYGGNHNFMYPADIQPMTFDEKQRLVHRITMLPSQYLRGLIDVIKKYEEDTVSHLDEAFVLDLEQMRENTVWAINDYARDAFFELDEYVKGLTNTTAKGPQNINISMMDNWQAPQYSTSSQSNRSNDIMTEVEEPATSKRRHIAASAAVDNATIQVLQTNGQEKFMEQVELYSKPKQTKKKSKPSERHQCHECSKQFRGRSELENHIRTHTKEKPLICSFEGCDKRFAHSSNLRAHERSHEGIKPYVCHYDGCGKGFAHSVSLKEHIWMHAGVQPYLCSFPGCSKRFTQVSNFARHKKLHMKAAEKASANNPNLDYVSPSGVNAKNLVDGTEEASMSL
jgi:hypothetical protein